MPARMRSDPPGAPRRDAPVSGTDARQWSFGAHRKAPGGWSDSARGAEGLDAYYARWCERAAAKRRSNPSAVLLRNATPSVFHQRHICTGAAIIVQCWRTKTWIVTRSRTSFRPMPFSSAG
jgi:hypothetical protein